MEEKKQEADRKRQNVESWGFQNDVTAKLYEARMKKRNNVKKKKELTADEKLQRFRMINTKKQWLYR